MSSSSPQGPPGRGRRRGSVATMAVAGVGVVLVLSAMLVRAGVLPIAASPSDGGTQVSSGVAAASSVAGSPPGPGSSPVAGTSAAARTAAPAGPSTPGATPAPGSSGGQAWFTHAYLIMMENHEYGQIVGSPEAPYLNSLVARGGVATQYYANVHGSQPDYLDLVAGSTLGTVDNTLRDFSAPNLFDQLDQHGLSWHVYAQDVPGHCFRGAHATGGIDLAGAAGTYERAHEPAISFTSIRSNQALCGRITPLASFDPAAASFELIVPNLQNDMDMGSVAAGDAFLKSFVPRILDAPSFAHGVLFIAWDEGTTNSGGGGRVPLIVVGPGIQAGFRSATRYTHFSVLRTFEDAWGLPCLAGACASNDLRAFFGR